MDFLKVPVALDSPGRRGGGGSESFFVFFFFSHRESKIWRFWEKENENKKVRCFGVDSETV